MQLKTNSDTFDRYQQAFVREMIEQIRFRLAEGGITGDKLRELTGHIAFSVTSTIDDTARIESDGEDVRPYLTFRTDDDQLIHLGENSYSHEYVADLVNKVFAQG